MIDLLAYLPQKGQFQRPRVELILPRPWAGFVGCWLSRVPEQHTLCLPGAETGHVSLLAVSRLCVRGKRVPHWYSDYNDVTRPSSSNLLLGLT